MTQVRIPHRIPAEARLARLVNAGIITQADIDTLLLKHHRAGRVDLEAVVSDALGEHKPPWTDDFSGTLQLAVEDDNGEPTGEIVELRIENGVVDAPDEHLAHVLAGVHGAQVVEGAS